MPTNCAPEKIDGSGAQRLAAQGAFRIQVERHHQKQCDADNHATLARHGQAAYLETGIGKRRGARTCGAKYQQPDTNQHLMHHYRDGQ